MHKALKPFHSAEKNILRFDGKCFAKLYGQTRVELCLKDNLVALKAVKNKKSETIFNIIQAVLNSVAVVPYIVVSDTKATNTGRLNGVVTNLHKEYLNLR